MDNPSRAARPNLPIKECLSMNRLRWPLLAVLCCLASVSVVRAAPVRTERSGLEQVPASSSLVFYLRGVQGTRDRFVTMMQNALPDVLKLVQDDLDKPLKDGFDGGRKIRGLPKDGPIFIALTELPDPNTPVDPPKIAVVLAVSDYKAFRDNILSADERSKLEDKGDGMEAVTIKNESKPTYFINRKGFAIVTPNEEVAKSFTKKQTGLDTKMSKEQAAKLLASDAGIYVNMDDVNKVYGEQIKQGKEFFEQQVLGPLQQVGDESQKKTAALFAKAITPIFQAVADLHSSLATVEFRPGGLAVHFQSEVNENTSTANLLQDSRPVDFKDLDRLPAGRSYYSGMKTSMALYKGLGSMMVNVPLGKADESKAVVAALDELVKAGPTLRLDGFSFPMAGLQVYHYDDPAKAVAAQVKMYKALAKGDPDALGFKEKPVLKMDAEKYGDFKLHSFQVALDYDKMAEALARGGDDVKKKFIDGMKGFLGDKTRTWFGTDGKTMVQINAASWDEARKLLDRYSKSKDGAGDDKAYREARKELPARASFLGLIDAVQLFGSIWEEFKPLLGGRTPPGFPNLPGKGTTSYVGLAVTFQPQRASFDLFITASAAQEVYKALVKPLMQ
jgi:hypothetical protein